MPRYLAIDADANGLFAVSGTVGRGAVKLDQTLAFVEDGPPLSPATAKALGAKLKELLKQAGVAPAPVLLCVGRDRVILKDVKYPPTPPADEPAVVRFQALKEMTDAADDVAVDYAPVPSTGGGEKQATVVFLRREILAAARVFCEAAGLKLAGVTPRPFATVAAAGRAVANGLVPPPERADSVVGVLTLTDRGGEFTVARAGVVKFSRSLTAAALASEAALLGELRRNMTVFAGQSGGGEVEAVYLAEAAGGAGWHGRLLSGLPVPVYPFDPVANAPAAEMIPAPVRGRFAGPVGLLAAAAAGPLPINFQQPRQPRAAAGPQRTRNMVAIAAGVLLAASAAAAGYYLVSSADGKVEALQAELKGLEENIARGEPDVVRLAAADDFSGRETVWIDELYDLSDRFPDIGKMKVTSMVGTALPPQSDKDKQKDAAAAKAVKGPAAKVPPKPVSKLVLTVSTNTADMPDQLVSTFSRDSQYYSQTKKTGGGLIGGPASKSKDQQYVIETLLAHRPAAEFKRRLTATLPKILAPVPLPDVPPAPQPDPDDAGGGNSP